MKKIFKNLIMSLLAIVVCFSFVNIASKDYNNTFAEESIEAYINVPDEELGGDESVSIRFVDYDGTVLLKDGFWVDNITIVDGVCCDKETLKPKYYTGTIPTPNERVGYKFIGYDKDPYTTIIYSDSSKNVFTAQYESFKTLIINYRVLSEEKFGNSNEFYKTELAQKVFYYEAGANLLTSELQTFLNESLSYGVSDDLVDYKLIGYDALPETINEDLILTINYERQGLVTLKYYTQLVFDYDSEINMNFLAYLTVQKLIPIGETIDVNLFNTHEKVFKKYDDSLSFYNNIPHVKFLNWDNDLIVTGEEVVIHGNYEMPQINVRYIDCNGEFVDEISYDFEWFTIDEINTGKFIDYSDAINETIRYLWSKKYGKALETLEDIQNVNAYLKNVGNYDTEYCKIITGFCLPSCQIEGMYKGLLGYGTLSWNKLYMWYVEGTPANNDYKFLINPEAYCSELFVPSLTCTFENALDKSIYQVNNVFKAIGNFFSSIGNFFADCWDWILNNWYWLLLIVVAILVVVVLIKIIKRFL